MLQIDCNGCPFLSEIPVFFTKLVSYKLNYIPLFLNCNGCPLLTKIAPIEHLTVFTCSGCPLLTKIPMLKHTMSIMCNDCPLLSEIPELPQLDTLVCKNCPLLTKIPKLPNLQKIFCRGCPLLFEIKGKRGMYIDDDSYVYVERQDETLAIKREYLVETIAWKINLTFCKDVARIVVSYL
jgi:hypothetical protein